MCIKRENVREAINKLGIFFVFPKSNKEMALNALFSVHLIRTRMKGSNDLRISHDADIPPGNMCSNIMSIIIKYTKCGHK